MAPLAKPTTVNFASYVVGQQDPRNSRISPKVSFDSIEISAKGCVVGGMARTGQCARRRSVGTDACCSSAWAWPASGSHHLFQRTVKVSQLRAELSISAHDALKSRIAPRVLKKTMRT